MTVIYCDIRVLLFISFLRAVGVDGFGLALDVTL